MRREDFYIEQYFGDEHQSITDAPQWKQQALPMTKLNMKHRDRYMNPLTAKVLLGDHFDLGRLPPADVVATVRRQSWKDLEDAGGSLDAVGDRLYVLYFRSMYSKLSYVKVGRAENEAPAKKDPAKKKDTAQVRKRISAHEGEAKIAQAVLFNAWISRPCESAVEWEKRVKAHLRDTAAAPDIDLGEQVKAEYFRGVPFRRAVLVAELCEVPSGAVRLAQ
ncbi:hypothetical protein OG361_40725 [Streptomyces sp. NBC_00090]|uniref:hypothetical protein n=1 Tax=Streptomyces sp. NBC_00090 TaxID=2903619 RepID=UPI0032490852